MEDTYNVKAAVEFAIRNISDEQEYRINQGLSPQFVSKSLEKMGWVFISRDGGSVDEWTYDMYISEAYPDIRLFMVWHAWRGTVYIHAQLKEN